MFFALALLAGAPTTDALDRLFADVTGRDRPGCAVDVRRGGAVLRRASYGMADLETDTPISADTVFEAGSVSKQFVAGGVAFLAAQGTLSLDDRVRRWIPELPALYSEVTVRMLLNHTSGVRNWNNFAELTGLPEGTRTYDENWTLRAIARQAALNNVPGTEYLYSNSNYVLASIVVERASGKPLQAFYRDEIFAPLGMSHTRWRVDHLEVVPGRAQAYQPGKRGVWRLEMPFNDVVGPGGLLTTVGDMQRWNDALTRPGPRDSRWVSMMTVPGRLLDGTETKYALGLELDDVDGVRAISHAGATASYRSWLGRFPDTGLSVAVLCNAGDLNTQDLGPAVAALYLPQRPAQVVPPVVTSTAAPSAGVGGLYRNMASDVLVEVKTDAGAVRFGGGPAFRASGADMLTTADGTRSAQLTRARDGTVARVRVERSGNAPAVLERVSAWSPTAATLRPFQGTFRAPDVDGDQRFEVTASALTWRDPLGAGQPLKPVYVDAFEAPESGWTLRFRRDVRGRVTGVDMSIGRARRIAFRRVD